VAMGATVGGASADQREALDDYAYAIGLAFQVRDDILDATADSATLGKRAGVDAANRKPTYVSLLGLEDARERADSLLEDALDALENFDDSAWLLRDLARYIVARAH